MELNKKVLFVEYMLQERYKESDTIYLRRCHLKYAKCSFNFRNLRGNYYWHNDMERLSEPKKIIII